MNTVADEGATQTIQSVSDDFGGRPMFRDESSQSGGESATAEIDISAMDDMDDFGGSSPRFSGLTKKLLLGAGFLVLLLVGGGGAFLIATNSSSGGSDAGLAGDDSPTEPVSLESSALFPESVDVAGQKYELAVTDDTDKCETVAHGDYGAALTENDCRQIVRATYVNDDKTRAVTVGIAAMGAAADAEAAQGAQDPGATEWFAGLRGKEGSGAERMEYAGGHGSGAQWGPYLVFSLAANSDGRVSEAQSDELAELSEGFLDTALGSLGEQA